MELDASHVAFWHLLHCGGNGWNCMLHVCLSGISSIVGGMDGTGCFTCAFDPSIVAVMDGTGIFTCAFLESPPFWR